MPYMSFGPEGLYAEANLAILFRTLNLDHPLSEQLDSTSTRIFQMQADRIYPNPDRDRQAAIEQAVDRATALLSSAVEFGRLYRLNQGRVDVIFRLAETIHAAPAAIPAIAGPCLNGDNPLRIRLPVVQQADVLTEAMKSSLFADEPQGGASPFRILVQSIRQGDFKAFGELARKGNWWASVVPLHPDARAVASRAVKSWRDLDPAGLTADHVSILQVFSTVSAFDPANPAARDTGLTDAEQLLSPLGADWSLYPPASRSIAKVAVLRAYLDRMSSVLDQSWQNLGGFPPGE